jgi:hypothetical protein
MIMLIMTVVAMVIVMADNDDAVLSLRDKKAGYYTTQIISLNRCITKHQTSP